MNINQQSTNRKANDESILDILRSTNRENEINTTTNTLDILKLEISDTLSENSSCVDSSNNSIPNERRFSTEEKLNEPEYSVKTDSVYQSPLAVLLSSSESFNRSLGESSSDITDDQIMSKKSGVDKDGHQSGIIPSRAIKKTLKVPFCPPDRHQSLLLKKAIRKTYYSLETIFLRT